MDLNRLKISILPAIVAAFTALSTVGPVIFWVGSTASKAEAKNTEQDDRLNRQREQLLRIEASLQEVQKASYRMEGMLQFLVKKYDP